MSAQISYLSLAITWPRLADLPPNFFSAAIYGVWSPRPATLFPTQSNSSAKTPNLRHPYSSETPVVLPLSNLVVPTRLPRGRKATSIFVEVGREPCRILVSRNWRRGFSPQFRFGQERAHRLPQLPGACLTVTIWVHRSRCAAFEGADASGAESFGRNQADGAFATLTVYADALTLYLQKQSPLLRPVDVPETEIILIAAHLSAPHDPQAADEARQPPPALASNSESSSQTRMQPPHRL